MRTRFHLDTSAPVLHCLVLVSCVLIGSAAKATSYELVDGQWRLQHGTRYAEDTALPGEDAANPGVEPLAAKLMREASEAYERDDYQQAEQLARKALAQAHLTYGDEHVVTGMSMSVLANALIAQARYDEAMPLHRKTLAMCEKIRGRNHPDTAINLNNLSTLLAIQGRFAQAERLNRRALAILEGALPSGHPETLLGLLHLGYVLRRQDRFGEAETLYRRGLAVSETALVPIRSGLPNFWNPSVSPWSCRIGWRRPNNYWDGRSPFKRRSQAWNTPLRSTRSLPWLGCITGRASTNPRRGCLSTR